jgi:hypothetical protein
MANIGYQDMIPAETPEKGHKKGIMQKITPFLWFNDNAEEAVKFYESIFKKSKIGKIAR